MYALKRIFAYLIDMALVFLPARYYADEMLGQLDRLIGIPAIFASSFWMIQSGIPILALGFFVGLFGKSPGKLVMFLKVVNESKRAPGLAQGILREIIKVLCGMFLFGALYALYGVITRGKAFYDDWLSLDVEDQKPIGLTDRQKKWREYSRKNQAP